MHTVVTEDPEEPAAEIPEDVATLYTWANLQGAKYRDFSGSRREYRAQVRHRAAEDLLQAELRAQVEAEKTAAAAEQVAAEALRLAQTMGEPDGSAGRERSLIDAEEASRRAAADRVEAARRAEAATNAKASARREEREIAGARAAAERQAARWSESEWRSRLLAGPQPVRIQGGLTHTEEGGRELRAEAERAARAAGEQMRPATGRLRGEADASGESGRANHHDVIRPVVGESSNSPEWLYPDGVRGVVSAAVLSPAAGEVERPQGSATQGMPGVGRVNLKTEDMRTRDRRATLGEAAAGERNEMQTPVLAVFSLAGGVGKTSLVATLGRVLSSLGEKLLLAEITSQSLLPYYFGATELKPGAMRNFSPPSGSTEASFTLLSYDVQSVSHDAASQDEVLAAIERGSTGSQRILLDLSAGADWLIRRLAALNLTPLIPVSPDMNSVLTLPAVEKRFAGVVNQAGRALEPIYLINQFDEANPLHVEIREALSRQLGDRLLPFTIRRAPAISESLAEGMTVVDYAPEAAIVDDYKDVAGWLRTFSLPAPHVFRAVRWSEQ